jgi:uncharacterized protein with HEPN domain
MFERQDLRSRLEDTLEALQRIPRRFESIRSADDFLADEEGRNSLDGICMVLMAVGEAFRQLDLKTKGEWLSRYPQIPWRDVIGVRNVIAHGYFDIDAEQVFNICRDDIPQLIETVQIMIKEV